MPDLDDCILGCIVGGAVGDYIGGPLETRHGPVAVKIPKSSCLTDDTQLTLATCEAIIKADGVDPKRIGDEFTKWFLRKKIKGIGSSTLQALQNLSSGMHWSLSGARGERSKGNGAAMRIAPVAFLVDPETNEGREKIRDVSYVTHRNEEAYIGALAIAIAISSQDFNYFPDLMEFLPDSLTRDRLKLLSHYENLSIRELGARYGSSGYVVDSVPLALIGARRGGDLGFKEALFETISCGGDTDTIGSMAGNILGSKLGLSNIPEVLRQIDLGPEPVLAIASQFADFVCGQKK